MKIIDDMKELADKIYRKIIEKKNPSIETPIRSLKNVDYNPETGFFEMQEAVKKRTLTASTAKTFAQTLKMISFAKEIVEKNDMATKREAYYVSKNWGEARFNEQPESDSVMDDVEALFKTNREKLGFIPEEDGGAVSGNLTIIDSDPETGETKKIDCASFGSGAYNIPNQVEHLKFETKADFILAIETAGMFQRLVKHKYYSKANCLLVSLKGVPSRATRRFIRKLSDEHKLPVYVFTDGDPYGWLNIYRTLKVGSGNSAHINKYFCVPEAKFIGITARDIKDYELPTHPLKDIDIKRLKDGLKNDPFIKYHKEWQKEIDDMIKIKRRAEQQALAAHGLNYVMEKYLPDKISNPEKWLP